MLSMRRISEAQDYIAKNYIRKDLQNPFIKIKGDKIYFPQESSKRGNPTLKNQRSTKEKHNGRMGQSQRKAIHWLKST